MFAVILLCCSTITIFVCSFGHGWSAVRILFLLIIIPLLASNTYRYNIVMGLPSCLVALRTQFTPGRGSISSLILCGFWKIRPFVIGSWLLCSLLICALIAPKRRFWTSCGYRLPSIFYSFVDFYVILADIRWSMSENKRTRCCVPLEFFW